LPHKPKLYACAIAAIILHCLALLAPSPREKIVNQTSKERFLNVELRKEKSSKESITTTSEKPIESEPKTQQEERGDSIRDTSVKQTDEPAQPKISLSTIEQWVKQETSDYLDQKGKTNLSRLRKESYTEKWLDPNRVDTSDSNEDTKIRTTDGVIWVSKVNGRLTCILVPNIGDPKTFYCGAPTLNRFLDEAGAIKNSDRGNWQFDD